MIAWIIFRILGGVVALAAVVEGGDGPRHRRALLVVGRVIVDAVIGQLLHGASQARRARR